MKIAIIIGSTRTGRLGESVGKWLYTQASQRNTSKYELVDLKDFDLPIFTGAIPPSAANKQYDNEATKRWSETIDSYDGYLFVTAEYNHSAPAAFKNAFDHLAPEWQGKPIAFAAYSYYEGKYTLTAWRQIVETLQMQQVDEAITFNIGKEVLDGKFTPAAERTELASRVLTELEKLVANNTNQ